MGRRLIQNRHRAPPQKDEHAPQVDTSNHGHVHTHAFVVAQASTHMATLPLHNDATNLWTSEGQHATIVARPGEVRP